eukprot:1366290-Prymnesium_polylepis.1
MGRDCLQSPSSRYTKERCRPGPHRYLRDGCNAIRCGNGAVGDRGGSRLSDRRRRDGRDV